MSWEWTLPMCIAAAEQAARAHGIDVRGYIIGGARPTGVHLDLVRGCDVVWVEVKAVDLDQLRDEADIREGVESLVAEVIRRAWPGKDAC